MKLILPILAIICTVLATFTAVVFCMSMGANAKPPEIRNLKLLMAGLALLGSAGVIVGVILIRVDQPGWASFAAFAPTVIFAIMLTISLLK